jgi:hypothetical protein
MNQDGNLLLLIPTLVDGYTVLSCRRRSNAIEDIFEIKKEGNRLNRKSYRERIRIVNVSSNDGEPLLRN